MNLFPLAAVHHRADVLARLLRRANLDSVGDAGGNFHGALIGGAFHQHPRRRVAALTRIVHHMAHAAFHRAVIGIGENQVGALAPQFQRDTLQRFRRRPGNGPARPGGPGEGDHFHIRMRRKLAAHPGPVAVDQVEHARRHTGIMAEFGKQHRGQRRFLGRFQHAGAARQQGRDHLQRDLVHRPVPGRDQADHPDGFQRHAVIRGMRPQRADELHGLEGGDEVFQVPGQAFGLIIARHVDGRTHFQADRMGHFFLARIVLRQNAFHAGQTLRRVADRPGGEGGLGGGDSGIGIGLPAEADHRAGVFGGRVDDKAVARGGGGHPGAVDVEAAFLDHGTLLIWRKGGTGATGLQAAMRPEGARMRCALLL